MLDSLALGIATAAGYSFPVGQPDDLTPGISILQVEATPGGADELETWRDRQLLAIVISWALPAVAFLATQVARQLSLRQLAVIFGTVALASAAAAPGLSVVFLLRRYKARLRVARLPRLPQATLRGASSSAGQDPAPPR